MAALNNVLLGRSGGGVPRYTEFAWVLAPNAAYQNITANVITQLYMNTVTQNGGFGSLTPNPWTPPSGSATTNFTLPIGTYYYEAFVAIATGATTASGIFGLFNATAGSYVSRVNALNGHVSYGNSYLLTGQMTLTQSTNFYLTFINYYTAYVMSGVYNATYIANSTPDIDQRTTFKVWKLA
jgi:hypothetical protein